MVLDVLSAAAHFVPWQALGCALGSVLEAVLG